MTALSLLLNSVLSCRLWLFGYVRDAAGTLVPGATISFRKEQLIISNFRPINQAA